MGDIVIIGDYELLEKQNEGEWFDEFKARSRNTNEIVLMARVKNGLDGKGIESRFSRLKECSDEHLVRYIDVVKKDEELWIVMEESDCYSLSQFMEHKDYMTEEQLREIARGGLLGLKYLHERGIMHGGVRPVNLFLTEDGVVKLGYYGLTTQAECYSIKGMNCEGIRSFAYEVFEGEYEMKSDHPFVKECEGGNEVLDPLIKILKYQEYCEWILKKDVKDSYLVLCKNGLCWYGEGLVKKSYSVVMELRLHGVIEVDVESGELLRVNGEDVSGIEHNQVLDLSDDGERWEGDVLHNQPYGWGVLYDSENRRVYEGFRIGDANVCYGRSYYPENQKVEYEGGICGGMRWGRGIQYDRTGNTVFDGEWMKNEQLSKRVVVNEENQFPHNHIEELIVSNGCCNGREWTALDLSLMSSLRLLEVGEECFAHVEEVKLIGLSQLERVVIGENSFTKENGDWGYDPDRHFYLKNCERLRELKIDGDDSFSDYSVCEIENVPSLEVIEMGGLYEESFIFYHASELELKNLPSLKSLLFGMYSFSSCSRAVFENLPELTSIRLGKHAFWFKYDDDSTELIMRSGDDEMK
ncbi:hypothetical protein BLSTO_03386 [Blastocystis sp. subtype 1]